MWNVLSKLLSDKAAARVLLCIAARLASNTSNKIDDQLVKALQLAVAGKEYGLQRKPNSPIKQNAKTQKA